MSLNTDTKIQILNELDVSQFSHLNGQLIDHLIGTKQLLESWNAPEILCDAGLFHAIYGTDGYQHPLISPTSRLYAKNLIGVEVEQIVYTYCACDREFVWPQFGINKTIKFLDRFTGEYFLLPTKYIYYYCELTAANELELALNNVEFQNKYRGYFSGLYNRMSSYLSEEANVAIKNMFS